MNSISNPTKSVNFLSTNSKPKLPSKSKGQIQHSSSTSNIIDHYDIDKKGIRGNLNGHDSELEAITVPMLDSSPGGKKSFRFEKEENSCCDTADDYSAVKNVHLEKTNINENNDLAENDCISDGNKNIPIVISKPLPTPGVQIILPSPCETASRQTSPPPHDTSCNEITSDTTPLSLLADQQLLNNTKAQQSPPSNFPSNDPKPVLKRQPPPLPPRGIVTQKLSYNTSSPSSVGYNESALQPTNTSGAMSAASSARLSAECAGSAGGMTPRRLSAAATSLSEGKPHL